MSDASNKKVTKSEKHTKTSGDKPLRIGTGLPGPGRPKKADEQEARLNSLNAIKKKYGSIEKGFMSLLESRKPQLIQLCFEYAFGKPAEKLTGLNGIPFNQLNIQVIATNKQSNGPDESANDSSISAPAGQQ